jgi:hypothetical protein
MDTNCAEESRITRLVIGFALVALCIGIGVHALLVHGLERLGDSMTESDMVVENVDEVVDDLNRLDISMRAFLSAGDGRFSDDVVLNVTELEVHMESLLQLPIKRQRLKRGIGKLTDMVKLALDSAGSADQIRHLPNNGSEVCSLDRSSSLECARIEAAQLKDEARENVFTVLRTERTTKSLLELLF